MRPNPCTRSDAFEVIEPNDLPVVTHQEPHDIEAEIRSPRAPRPASSEPFGGRPPASATLRAAWPPERPKIRFHPRPRPGRDSAGLDLGEHQHRASHRYQINLSRPHLLVARDKSKTEPLIVVARDGLSKTTNSLPGLTDGVGPDYANPVVGQIHRVSVLGGCDGTLPLPVSKKPARPVVGRVQLTGRPLLARCPNRPTHRSVTQIDDVARDAFERLAPEMAAGTLGCRSQDAIEQFAIFPLVEIASLKAVDQHALRQRHTLGERHRRDSQAPDRRIENIACVAARHVATPLPRRRPLPDTSRHHSFSP